MGFRHSTDRPWSLLRVTPTDEGATDLAGAQMMNGNGAPVASWPPDKAAVPKNPCIAGR